MLKLYIYNRGYHITTWTLYQYIAAIHKPIYGTLLIKVSLKKHWIIVSVQDKYHAYMCIMIRNIWSLSVNCEYRLKSGLGQRAGRLGVRGWCCKDKNVADLTPTHHSTALLHRTIFCPVTDSTAQPFIPQQISLPSLAFPAKHRFHQFSPECSHIWCLCFPRNLFLFVRSNWST